MPARAVAKLKRLYPRPLGPGSAHLAAATAAALREFCLKGYPPPTS